MDVFISWSGDRGRQLAHALKKLLASVIQRVKPWMSEADIGVGKRWNHELSDQLSKTDFGIVCVTPESISSPWLLFEAGALAKAVDTGRVVPILLGIRRVDLGPPLGQFQAVEVSRDEIRRLIIGVNSATQEDALSEEILLATFEAMWPQFDSAVASIPASMGTTGIYAPRTDRQLLEEVLETVRRIRDPAPPRQTDTPMPDGAYAPLLAAITRTVELGSRGEAFDLKELLDEIERIAVLSSLRSVGTQTGAARSLGITFRSFRYLVQKHGLKDYVDERDEDEPDQAPGA